MANLLRRPRPSRLQLPQSSPAGGHRGGGGFQPLWNGQLGATGVPTINAHATRAQTADDVIARQGGLSPGFGPTGINGLQSKGPVAAWQALQNEMNMASPEGGNNPGAADNMARVRQDRGMGNLDQAQGGQDMINDANRIGKSGWGDDSTVPALDRGGTLPIHDAVGGPPLGGAISPNAGRMGVPVSLDALRVAGGNPVGGGATFPGGTTLGIGSPQMLGAMGYADGGEEHDTPMATVAEKEPEYMFNNDGTMERFDKPTLLQGHKPGVIIPGHEITRLVARYRRPPRDVATVAFDDGGMMADNADNADSGNGATPLAYKRGGSLMAGPKEKKPLMKVSGYAGGGQHQAKVYAGAMNEAGQQLHEALFPIYGDQTDAMYARIRNGDKKALDTVISQITGSGGDVPYNTLFPGSHAPEHVTVGDVIKNLAYFKAQGGAKGAPLNMVTPSSVNTPVSTAIPAAPVFTPPVFGGDDSTGENAPAPLEPVLDSSGDGDVPVTPAKPALQQPGFRRSRVLHSWEEPGYTIADRAEAGRSAVSEGKALQEMGMSLRSHPTDSPIPSYADPNSQRLLSEQSGLQPSVETEQNRLAVQRAHPPSKPFVDPQTGEITPLGQEAIETGGAAMSVPPPMPRGMKAPGFDKGGLMGGGSKKRKPLML